MDFTSYLITSVDTMNVAALYACSSGVYTAPYGCYPSAPWYAGALLKSNPLELAHPLVAFMQGGEVGGTRILEDATVDTMMTVQYPALNQDQGLGWHKVDDFFGRLLWGHYGSSSADFGNTAMFFCPAENSAVIVMQNCGPPEVRQAVMNYLFNYISEEMGVETGFPSVASALTVHPNPFTSCLSISYSLPGAALAELSVYDLSGRLVENLESASVKAGEHASVWNPDPVLPDGCYLIVLDTGGARAVSRCVKLN